MPIYKVTTEDDCEGRSTKHLAYVEADSPEHAVKYLKSIGVHEYYEYYVDVVLNSVHKAVPEETLNMWVAELSLRPYSKDSYKGKVVENTEVRKRCQQTVREAMKRAGLSYEDVVNFGKGE